MVIRQMWFGYKHPKAAAIYFGIVLSVLLFIWLHILLHATLVLALGFTLFIGILYQVILFLIFLQLPK